MKYFLFVAYLISVQFCFGQSELSTPETECKFILGWTCDVCTFNWSEDCVNNLPSGTGILTVFHGDDEIMRYDGEMENGKFHGAGIYHDGMNDWEGTFEYGNFVETNPHLETRAAMIDTTSFNKTKEWELKPRVTKQVGNLYFTFPSEGYAYDHRDSLVDECLAAIKENCKIIKDPEFTEFTRVMFVDSKTEMLLHADLFIKGGMVNIWTRSVYMMVTDIGKENETSTNPPIKHEFMHLVSMTEWGSPPQNNNWLNEGLATYAGNNCSGYTVAEIYRYFLEEKMLVPIETLTSKFYHVEEMIGYHQSAYIVEFMISNYEIEKLEELWKNGFSSFENIYGFTFSQMEIEINKHVIELYPISPGIDWILLKEEGCK